MTGNNLSSQAASSPVLSTRESLTAVFGMGTGGTSQPSSPDLWTVFLCSRFVKTASRLLDILQYAFAALAGLSLRSPQKSSFILQVFSDPQYRTEETTCNKLTCLALLALLACKSSPRRISTGPLNTLLHLHSRPINLVFSKASYWLVSWEISSWGWFHA